MKNIGVLTDSHSGITQKMATELGVKVLPMPFFFDEKCYYEDIDITRDEFFHKLKTENKISTSQPTPTKVMEFWDEALNEFKEIIYIPISSGLSGSCQTAKMLAMEEEYKDRVYVVDNGRVSTPLHRAVLDALELIEEGYSALQIQKILEHARADMNIYIGVEDINYLKKGGRISKTSAIIGNVLNIKPVLKFDVGTLDVYKKCRGFISAKKTMIEAMKTDLETKFKQWYDNGEVYLLAASSAGEKETIEWVEQIKEAFPGNEVICDNLSFGVSCHIGPGGLGIGCSCKPKRVLDK